MQAPLKCIHKVELHLTINADANIYDTVKEALILSFIENRDVKFKFNDKEYIVMPSTVIAFVKAQHPNK